MGIFGVRVTGLLRYKHGPWIAVRARAIGISSDSNSLTLSLALGR
jgi:hypothetical protein